MDKVIRQGLLFSAGFDAKSEKEMKARVSEIIASASNINFDIPENKKSLQSLISVFRDMFESVGNKKIDFSKMLNLPGPEMFDAFKKSANEITDVWADVVSRMGVNSLRNVFMKDERSLSDALERLTKNGKFVETRLKNIKQAFKDVRSTDINRLLSDAIGAEVNFNTAETWEERTAAALRYIKIRDKILSVKNSESFDINEIDRHQMDFFKDITDSEHRLGAYFVRDLKEVIPEMQTSLNNIFNLFRKVEIDVVPKVVKVLDIGDILGGKKMVVVDVTPEVNDDGIDTDFKQKLESLYDAYQKAQFRLAREIEGDLLSSVPEGLQKALQSKLQSVMGKAVLKDADYEDLWGEFRPYIGTGMGTGDGTGSGDASSSEIESLRQQREEAEERANMYRHAMDSMQEEMADLRGQLVDAEDQRKDSKSGYRYGDRYVSREEEINYLKEVGALTQTDLSDEQKINDVIAERRRLWEEFLDLHNTANISSENLEALQNQWPREKSGFALSPYFTFDEHMNDIFPRQHAYSQKLGEFDDESERFAATSDIQSVQDYIKRRFDIHLDWKEIFEKWFFKENREARDAVGDVVSSHAGMKDASLVSMWHRYNYNNKTNLPYEEFLQTPMPVYRADDNPELSDNNNYLSFSMDKDKAKKFGEQIAEYIIRPIDTIGTPNVLHDGTRNEDEVLIRADLLKRLRNQDISTEQAAASLSEDVENARKVAEYEARARTEAEAKEKADKRRNELAEQMELYDDDENTYDLEESEGQKAALQEILNALKQENLLTDELQARYDSINSKIDERISLLQSVRQAYDSLETADNIDYNMYDVDEVQQALDKRKEIVNAIPQNVLDNDDDIAGWVEEIQQGNLELEKRIGLLQQVKQGLIDIDSVDDIMSETGDLDSKLSRLQDVASAWGSDIKDSDVDEDNEALEALQEFEATYDRIILKLASGRKIEILPNAKGLRALHKYDDGIDSGAYGETEIEDIEFVRKEALVHQENTAAINNEISARDALIKKAAQYTRAESFIKENANELKSIGVKHGDQAREMWKQGRMLHFSPIELTKEDAIAILREKVPDNILEGWFRRGDAEYKPLLEELALSDNDIRNAALNIMWDNYKEFSKTDLGFDDFLHSDISMYRGKNSEKYTKYDDVISFTFDREVAEKFGKYVLETLIKPIETLGSYQTTGESETLVYRKSLEYRPEYQEWHSDMANQNILVEAEIEGNQKKIQSYNELSAAVSRYVELAKSLVDTENNTPEHMQIERDMDIVDTWRMDSQEDFIAVINEWQTNIGKIKAAIKAGADTYRTEDGYVENITDDTLSRAESTLRGYIYRYAENWNDVDSLLAGAKTKTLKNIITKEIGKYTSDQDIQKQQEEIAEAANAAALEEMESIEKSIEDSALDGKRIDAWDKLTELKYKADKVDRFTQSTQTDDIAKDLGIVSPHEEIENNAKAIKSYEELCEVIQRYGEIRQKRVIFAGDEYPTPSEEEENEFADLVGRLNATRDGVKLTYREIEGDINKLAQLLGIEIPQAAQQAQQAVDGLNSELQEAGGNADNINNQVEDNAGLSAGSGQTDGATVDEVQNLEAIRAKVAEITSAVELKTKAFTDEAAAVNTAVESEIKQLGDLETKVKSVSESLATLLNNIKSGESDLGAGLGNIVVNVNNPKEPEGESSSTNQEILNQILNNIYSVIIKSDVSNEPGAPTESATQEPWALEKTLLGVKEILVQIQTNTTPIVENKTPVQPKSTLPETRLSEIKELLGKINDKIVKGTKASASKAKTTGSVSTTQKPLSTAYSIEKKETQKLTLKKLRTELEESGRLTDDLRKKMNTLSRSLGQVKDGEALAKWNERFKQFKLETDTGAIKDKYKDKRVISSYKELIDVQKTRNSLEVQYEKAKDGSKLKQYYKDQIADIDQIIAKQKIRNKNAEQEAKLAAMQTKQDRKLGAVRASKEDVIKREQEARARSEAEAKAREAEAKRQLDLKQKEAETVRELIVLWEKLGVAKGNGDAVEEARLKQEIKDKRSGLTSVDYATNMKFKRAKEKGFNSVVDDQDAAVLSEQQKKVQRLTALYRELGTAEAKLENTKDGAVDNDTIKNNISGLLEQINLEGALNDVLQRQMETTRQLAKEKTKRAQAEAGSRKSLKDEINANKKQASANKVASSSRAGRDILFTATTLDFDFSENNAEVQKLAKSLKDLDDLEKKLADNDWVMNKEDREALAQATSEVNKHTESVKLLVNSAKMFGNDNSIDLHRNIGAGDIKAQLIDAAKAAHGAKFRFEEFDDELQTITGTLKVGPREFRKVTIGVNQFSGAIRESQGALKKTETFMESFKRKLNEISSYFSASSVIFKAISMLKQGVQYVRDIDLALTELKKVTDETEETYDEFLKTAAKTGARLGTTISAVTEATATFAKLGYSMTQATEMAEAAIVYKNVGDNIASTGDAADSIISTMKGFGLEATESMAIVDKFNEVGE